MLLSSVGTASSQTPPASHPAASQIDTLPDSAWMEIHFVDVGSGDGILIKTWDDGIPGNRRFDGKHLVIDGGPVGGVHNAFIDYLHEHLAADAVIDALFVSHPHDDHYSGAGSVLQQYPVCAYYDDGYDPGGSKYGKFKALVAAARCHGAPTPVHSGRAQFGSLWFGDELQLDALYAYPGSPAGLGKSGTLINSGSIVLKLTYGTESFLFLGDLEGKDKHGAPDELKFGERKLLEDTAAHARLASTLVKLGHHGSETSSTNALIAAVHPRYVIVTSGRRDFDTSPGGQAFLPDRSTLERWCASDPSIRIYRTDQDDEAEGLTVATDKDGDHIVVRTNGKTTTITASSGGHPFVPAACSP
jgi:competence protein ComEC